MADFNAAIDLSIRVEKALQGIKNVENQINNLAKKAAGVSLGLAKDAGGAGVRLATRNVRDYVNTLGKLDRKLGGLGGRLADVARAFDFGGKTVVGVAGINALSNALSKLPGFLTGGNSALQDFGASLAQLTSPINNVVEGLQTIGPAGLATAGGVAAATAAFLAFAPAASTASRKAREFLNDFKLGDIDVSQDLISEKTFRDALRVAQSEQSKLSAGTAEYTRKTEEVVALQRELTGELRRQQIIYEQVNAEQLQIAENVKRNIRSTQETVSSSGFRDFQRSLEDRRAVQGALRRQGLVDVDPIGPATKLGSLEADRQRFEFAEQKEKELAALTSELEDRVNREEKASAERLFQLKLDQIEKLAAAQLEQSKRVNQAELDDFDRRFDETVRKKQRAFDAPIGPGNAEGIAQFRRIRAEVEKTAEIQREADARAERSARRRLKAERKIRKIKEAAAKRRKDRFESIALGVGFPLLFGGGLGSIAGSAAGSFFGKGFGGQILLGGIGQAIDQLIASSLELAKSFGEVEKIADVLIEKNIASSKATQKQVEALTEAGDVAGAAAIAQRDLNRTLGTDQFRALQSTSQAVSELDREFQILVATIQIGTANAIKPAITLFAKLLKTINIGNQVNELNKLVLREGTKAQQDKFRQTFNNLGFTTADKEKQQEIIDKFRNDLERELGIKPVEIPVRLQLESSVAALQNRITQLSQTGNALSIIERFSGNNDAASRQRIQNQRAIEDQERRVAQFRLGVERKIQDIRLRVIQEQNRQADRQAALARQAAALDNRASERSALVGAGTDPVSNTRQNLLQSANAFNEALQSAQDERLKKRRDNALEIKNLELQSARAIADLQRQAAEINLQAARKAADIADRRRTLDTQLLDRRFRFEKLISSLRLQEALVQVELDRQRAVEQGILNEKLAAQLQERKDIIQEAQAVVQNAQRPPQAAEVASAGTGPLASFDETRLKAVNQQLATLLSNRDKLSDQEFGVAVRKAGNDLLDSNKALLQSIRLLEDRQRLLKNQEVSKDFQRQGFSAQDSAQLAQGSAAFITRDIQLNDKFRAELEFLNELFKLPEAQQNLPQIKLLIKDVEKSLNDTQDAIDLNRNAADLFVESFKKIDKVQEDLKKIATEIAGVFANGLTDAITDAVTGVKTLGEAFQDLAADILKAIGQALILSAITKALGSVGTETTLGSGILGDLFRAEGGPVKKGQPYIVGEEGPELIVPSESGTVLPNEVFDDARAALRGSATSNADDTSDAFFAAAGALERNTQVINNRQTTTQQETSFNSFTEAMMRPGQSTVRFETVRVGDMDMVTKEEALEIGARSAKAAEASVFSALRNKPSVRRSLGMS